MPDSWNKAAGEVLTAEQAPHRPGTAPALGLRAGRKQKEMASPAKGQPALEVSSLGKGRGVLAGTEPIAASRLRRRT